MLTIKVGENYPQKIDWPFVSQCNYTDKLTSHGEHYNLVSNDFLRSIDMGVVQYNIM